jgi:hypothetical protein
MADLPYFNYKPYGDYALEHFGYNQAVRVGDKIELSGQGLFVRSSPPSTGTSFE